MELLCCKYALQINVFNQSSFFCWMQWKPPDWSFPLHQGRNDGSSTWFQQESPLRAVLPQRRLNLSLKCSLCPLRRSSGKYAQYRRQCQIHKVGRSSASRTTWKLSHHHHQRRTLTSRRRRMVFQGCTLQSLLSLYEDPWAWACRHNRRLENRRPAWKFRCRGLSIRQPCTPWDQSWYFSSSWCSISVLPFPASELCRLCLCNFPYPFRIGTAFACSWAILIKIIIKTNQNIQKMKFRTPFSIKNHS